MSGRPSPTRNGVGRVPRRDPRTGDVLVCYGRGWVAWLIEKASLLGTPSMWFSRRRVPCHVAMVVGPMDNPWRVTVVVESTSLSKRAELVTGRRVSGIQAHVYGAWLAAAQDRVELWRLADRPSRTLVRSAMYWLSGRFEAGAGYDFSQAIGSATPRVNREDDERLFCSELVCRWLELAGVIPEVNASEMHPLDVTRFECFEPEPEVLV